MEFPAVDKYRSMQRSYKRLEKINTNNGNEISNVDARDATEDFFNQTYHFKDWLKKDKTIQLLSDVEEYINRSSALALAADYCNSFKHGGLNKDSRSGKELQKINTHIKLDLTPAGFVASSRLEITIDQKSYDAFLLASNCINEWETFLEMNKIVFPEP